MYIGKNESMNDGFVGCVSRVEFDDIYPLKLLFQENGPPNVRSIGTQLTEDFCGVEPVTHPPIEIETRPPPLIDEDKLRKAYSRVDSVVLGGKYARISIKISPACANYFWICSDFGAIVPTTGDNGSVNWSLHESTQRRVFDARGQRSRHM